MTDSRPNWTLDIDGRRYSAIPESWLEHGYDKTGVGPQLLAVSAAAECRTIYVRYAHPTGTRLAVEAYPGVSSDAGTVVPRAMLTDAWPRSIAAGLLEPKGDIRLEEREYLAKLWGDRVDDVLDTTPDVDLDDDRLVADGGQSVDGTYQVELDQKTVDAHDCPACGGDRVLASTDECRFCGEAECLSCGSGTHENDWTAEEFSQHHTDDVCPAGEAVIDRSLSLAIDQSAADENTSPEGSTDGN